MRTKEAITPEAEEPQGMQRTQPGKAAAASAEWTGRFRSFYCLHSFAIRQGNELDLRVVQVDPLNPQSISESGPLAKE